jgi:hypothetical protein
MGDRRAITWLIEPDDKQEDTYDLRRGNRLVLSGQPLTSVMRHVRRNRTLGETVHRLADDLRVEDITKAFEPRKEPLANPRRTRLGFTMFRR